MIEGITPLDVLIHDMKWNNPDILLWLLALIPLILVTGLLMRWHAARLARMADRGLWATLLPTHSPRRRHVKNLLRILALALAVLALARPQWGFSWEKVQQRGLSILVALDTSKSMLAQDVGRSRLDEAKRGIRRDLVKQLKGDRIGLVAFAGEAFLQCPVTIDYAAFSMMLDDVYAGIVPVGGTDLYEALDTAIESYEKAEDHSSDKVIILISDGEQLDNPSAGDPLSLLPRLKEEGIRVFTIGIGTVEGTFIETADGYVKDSEGNVIRSSLNETLLNRLAKETGGFYVRAAQGNIGLDRVYNDGLSDLQRSDREERVSKTWTERYQWFLAASMLLLILEAGIRPAKKGGRK